MACTQLLSGQQTNTTMDNWNFLIGEWVGEGSGKPGQGEGKFSFQTELDGKILVRKNHTVFPETDNSKEMIHDDLLIVYMESAGATQEAIYFDNEGNTIKYKASFSGGSIILTSDIIPNTPRFRLTYILTDNKTVLTTFEIASPGTPDDFRMYISGKAFKTE